MKKPFKINMIRVGVFLAVVFWLLETILHVFLYKTGSFVEELFPSDLHDLIARSITVLLLFFFGLYVESILRKRKMIEKSLDKTRERLRQFMNSATDSFLLFNSDLNLIGINEAALRLVGSTEEELIGKSLLDMDITPNIKETPRYEEYLRVLKTGIALSVDGLVPHPRFGDLHLSLKAFKVGEGLGIIASDISELVCAEEKYSTIIRAAFDGFWISDLDGKILDVNDSYCRMVGYSRDELIGMSISDLEIIENPEEIEQHIKRIIERGSDRFETRHKRKDSEIIDIEISVNFNAHNGGQFISFIRDVTKRKQLQEELQKRASELRERVKELDCLYDISRITEKQGIPIDEIIQKTIEIIPPSWQYPEATCVFVKFDEIEYKTENCHEVMKKQASEIFVQGKKRGMIEVGYTEEKPELGEGPFLEEERNLIDAIAIQLGKIIELKLLEEKLNHSATHDSLTNLPNRKLLYDRLSVSIAQANRYNKKFAVMMLDLDNFKEINDAYGHSIGDKVLEITASRLTELLRKSDTVARIGGDEFVLHLSEIQVPGDALVIADKVLDSIAESMKIEGHLVNTSVSIGIAIYPENGEKIKPLLKKADEAMYLAKEHGRNRVEIYKG